jgi:hypothetical protein
MTEDSKAQVANAREEQQMSNENETQNEVIRTEPQDGYELGKAVARVVAEHLDLDAEQIVAVHMDSEHCTIRYAVRTGTRPMTQTRLRTIDPETGDTIRDQEA